MARGLILMTMLISGGLFASIGAPCQSDSACGNGEMCISEFNQGYCAQFDCSQKNPCSERGKCMSIEPENFSVCLKECTKNSDCRAGYRCYEEGVCLP